MNKKDKGKNTGKRFKSVEKEQKQNEDINLNLNEELKKKIKEEISKEKLDIKSEKKLNNEKEQIFKEVTINLGNTEYNQQKKKKKAKKTRGKIFKAIIIIIITIVLCFGAVFVKRMNENGWTLGGFVATILGHNSETLANLSRINILVIGQSQNLTDTMLICSYDPKTQDVGMLSIPRDTFVGRNKRYATASDKINAVYQIDPDNLLDEVNELTGMDIQYYVKVDTDGLRELVDSVGGVYFDVPIDMDYDDSSQDLYIHLKKGYQLLDGEKAEHVVRFRHNNDGSTYDYEYGQEDIGRMRTQREFITAVIKQLAKPENITKVDEFIKIANNNIETNFNLWNLKDYAPYVIQFNTENIKTATLPGVPEKCNGIWFYIHNQKETEKVVEELFATELTVEQEANSKIKISILNGTSDDMNANNLETLLEENGYTVVSTESTTKTEKTTIINRTGLDSSIAGKLKETVGVGVIANSSSADSSDDDEVDFTIIIGADY